MLLFGSECFIFQVAIHKFKDQDINNYNFAYFLYGCENLSLTLREERKLRVFENMVFRRLLGPRSDEVSGEFGDCIMRS